MRAREATFGVGWNPFDIRSAYLQTRPRPFGFGNRTTGVAFHTTDEQTGGALATSEIQLPFGIKTSDPNIISLVEQLKKVKKRTDGVDGLDLREIDFGPLMNIGIPETNKRPNLERFLIGLLDVEYPFANADLTEAHLERAILDGAFLIGAKLVGTHLDRANLAEAQLYRANLERAIFYRANLAGAHLGEAFVYVEGNKISGNKLREHLEKAVPLNIDGLDSARFE